MRSVAGLVMQAHRRLVEVDILALSESPWPGVGIFHTSMVLGRRKVKEIDLKLILGMTQSGDNLSLRLMRNHGEGSAVHISVTSKVYLSQTLALSCPIGHNIARTLNKGQKKCRLLSVPYVCLYVRLV